MNGTLNDERPEPGNALGPLSHADTGDKIGNLTFGLTKRQAELLKFIREYHARHGMTPTYREMMAGAELLSTAQVSDLVRALERRGHIRRLPGRARSIALCDGGTGL